MPDHHRLPNDVGAKLIRSIRMPFCEVRQYRDKFLWTWTEFPDGTGYGGTPDFSEEWGPVYARRAKRLGYDSVDEYCFVHDFFHSFLAWKLKGRASQILWRLAHGMPKHEDTPDEESLVIHFQEFVHGFREDDVMEAADPDIDWYGLRAEALRLLALAEDPVRDPVAAAALR